VSEREEVIEQIKFLTRIADHESVRFEDPTDAVESLFDRIAALEARAEARVTDGWIVWAKKRKCGKRHLVLNSNGSVFPDGSVHDAAIANTCRAYGLTEWKFVAVSANEAEWDYVVPLVLVNENALKALESL